MKSIFSFIALLFLISCNNAELERLKAENEQLRIRAEENASEAERQAEIAEEQAAMYTRERNIADQLRVELEECKKGK